MNLPNFLRPRFAFRRLASCRRRMVLPLLLAVVVVLPLQKASAAPKYGTSLDWVSADVSFYGANLRLKEQFDIVANSNAWHKIQTLPAVQMAWGAAQFFLDSPGSPVAQVREFFEDPDNIELRDLIVDGVSRELFMYGDKSATDFIETMLRTVNAMQYSGVVTDGADSNTSARVLLNSLNAHIDQLAAPGIVAGFKLSDNERAKKQLARLKDVLESHFEDEPKLRGRLKTQSAGGSDYLVLELDGTMIPWDEVPWGDLEEQPGQFDKLKAKLLNLKAVVCVGVHNDYLLFAIQPSLDAMAKLGTGKPLAEAKELEPLAKFADKKLTSVAFMSKQFAGTLNNTNQSVEDMVKMFRRLLPEADLSEEAEKRLGDDLEELGKDIKRIVPTPGAIMQFSFLTDRGIESYGHDWSENKYLDGSKPLSLLDHAGGNPLVAYFARTKYSPDQYDLVRKWAKKAYGYFEEFAVPQMAESEQETYKKVKEIGLPLVARLDKATGEMLLPALADGQSGVVLDAKLISKRWFEGMRQNDQPLPMAEVAIVFGVSDASLLKKAIDEYKSIANELIEKLKQEQPDALPADFKIPTPETREVKTAAGTGTIFFYKLPEGAGVDAQLTPNAGLSDRVAVLSIAPKQTARVLADTPLGANSSGPLGDRSKPLATALYFNWADTVDAISPWVEYGVRQVLAAYAADNSEEGAEENAPAAAPDDPQTKLYIQQMHTVLEVLKALRTVERGTYPEGGAMVTHSVTEFKDVP